MKVTPQKLLADLIKIPSPSFQANQPIIDYAVEFLRPRGWDLYFFPYRDGKGIEKMNMVAVTTSGTGKRLRPELALVAHTDTVPWDPAWTQATTLCERSRRLYGRGTCDMKGFIAAVFAAVADLDLKSLTKPLAIVLTADEEVGCVGAKHLSTRGVLHSRYAIVGEPTSLRPVRAGKGYGLAEITIRGREAHSAFPDRGISAVYQAARLITRIEQLSHHLVKAQNPIFDPPYSTLNVGTLTGGRAKNIIPGECRFLLEWRAVPDIDSKPVIHLIELAVAEARRSRPGTDIVIDLQRAELGFETSATSRLVQALEEISGEKSTTISFSTEASQMQKLAAEVVVFGPGDMREAHKTNEYIPKSEFLATIPMLKSVITKFCGPRPRGHL